MKVTHQYQNYGSELLEQPRDVIWLEVNTPAEEKVVKELCSRIHGHGVKAGLTGIHSMKGYVEKYNDAYPRTFIISMSHK